MLKNITFAVCLLLFVPVFVVAAEVPKELDAYIALPDDSYRWEIAEKMDDGQTFLVDLTSQTWHGIPWKHSLLVAIPNKLSSPDHALLIIEGLSNGDKPADMHKMLAKMVATGSGMCVAVLLQVPNQPLLGKENERGYVEDALIGESLLKAIETKDATWPLLFPMAKSAVRAMDAVQELLKKEKQITINSFIIGGASKRGWTTWMTAATGDKRVAAIVPMVIDNLNTSKQMEYQLETWGVYSESIKDYTDRNIIRLDNTPQSDFEKHLWTMIDPYAYLPRLTMPKLLIHGANDPYWTVDAAKWYFEDLPGVKYILTVPNAGHDLGLASGEQAQVIRAAMRIAISAAVFAKYAAGGEDWPALEWKLTESDAGYKVDITTDLPLQKVLLWTAQSETKDFRKATWTSAPVDTNGPLSISVAKPKSGHIAFFVEIFSRNNDDPPRNFSVTTRVWRF